MTTSTTTAKTNRVNPQTEIIVGGIDFSVKTGYHGSMLRPDGWTCCETMLDGDDFSTFRLKSGSPVIESIAVEIEVTGRTVQKDPKSGCQAIRVKVTFPGDCEPDTECGGWLYASWPK